MKVAEIMNAEKLTPDELSVIDGIEDGRTSLLDVRSARWWMRRMLQHIHLQGAEIIRQQDRIRVLEADVAFYQSKGQP